MARHTPQHAHLLQPDDPFVRQHLDAWAAEYLRPEDREALVPRMLEIVREHPHLLDVGWPYVRGLALSA